MNYLKLRNIDLILKVEPKGRIRIPYGGLCSIDLVNHVKITELEEEAINIATNYLKNFQIEEPNIEDENKLKTYLRMTSAKLKEVVDTLRFYHINFVEYPKLLFSEFDLKEKVILYTYSSIYEAVIINKAEKDGIIFYEIKLNDGQRVRVNNYEGLFITKTGIKKPTYSSTDISIPNYYDNYTLESIKNTFNELYEEYQKLYTECSSLFKEKVEEDSLKSGSFGYFEMPEVSSFRRLKEQEVNDFLRNYAANSRKEGIDKEEHKALLVEAKKKYQEYLSQLNSENLRKTPIKSGYQLAYGDPYKTVEQGYKWYNVEGKTFDDHIKEEAKRWLEENDLKETKEKQ